MNIVQTITGGLISIFFYALLCAAVLKLFNIDTELREIKELLKDRQRQSGHALTPLPNAGQSLPHPESAAAPEMIYNLEVVDSDPTGQS